MGCHTAILMAFVSVFIVDGASDHPVANTAFARRGRLLGAEGWAMLHALEKPGKRTPQNRPVYQMADQAP